MNNFIKYFYGLNVDKVLYNDKYYSFIYDDYLYKLYIYDDDLIKINYLYNINKILINNTLMSQIVVNRNGDIVSTYNNIKYTLIKIFVNVNKKISLNEISFISNTLYSNKTEINWGILWSKKIDYLEDLINENGKKFPLIVDSFNYFVGLAENAISYFNSIIIDNNYKYVISHRTIKFNDTVESLYNPLNIIFDYRVRDVAEYIKNSFFNNNNKDIFYELSYYLKNNTFSLMEVKLLISRILYPSFYFDMYEDILIDNQEEKILLKIISKLDSYEKYIFNIISFFKVNYDIDDIEWLKR